MNKLGLLFGIGAVIALVAYAVGDGPAPSRTPTVRKAAVPRIARVPRTTLIATLRQHGSAANPEPLLDELRRTKLAKRGAVAHAILLICREDPARVLPAILAVPLPPEGYGAVAPICHPGLDAAVGDQLAALLRDANSACRPALVLALGRCRAVRHEDAVVACIEGASIDLLRACHRALAHLQTERGAVILLRAIDVQPTERAIVARDWMLMRDESCLRAIEKRWQEFGPHARQAILRARNGSLQALSVRALDDASPEVRAAAARSVRSRSAAPSLVARLARESHPAVRRSILDSLRVVGTRETARDALAHVDEIPQANRLAYRRAYERQLEIDAPKHAHGKPP